MTGSAVRVLRFMKLLLGCCAGSTQRGVRLDHKPRELHRRGRLVDPRRELVEEAGADRKADPVRRRLR
jgi:hypothetical protein